MDTISARAHRIEGNGLLHHVIEWRAGARGGGGGSSAGDADEAQRDRSGDGATVILVHGYMDAAATWDLVAPPLVHAGLRVLAPDMRGFGDGARAPAGSYYHFPDYVADLAAIERALVSGAAPLLLVGHSMGGTIASLYAGAFPERVTKLALLEGVGPPDNPFHVAPVRMRRWITELEEVRAAGRVPRAITREDALRRLAANHPSVDVEVLRTRLGHLVRPVDAEHVTWSFDPVHRTMSPMPFYAAAYREFAKEVRCPVLFVSGGVNGYHPPDEDDRLDAFASVEREEIADAGHMMHWTRPAEVARLLLDFWRK